MSQTERAFHIATDMEDAIADLRRCASTLRIIECDSNTDELIGNAINLVAATLDRSAEDLEERHGKAVSPSAS